MSTQPTLSIINPNKLGPTSYVLDKNLLFNFENGFNPNLYSWEFYGFTSDLTKRNVGFNYSLGYMVSKSDPTIKYGVIHGLIVDFVETDDDWDDWDDCDDLDDLDYCDNCNCDDCNKFDNYGNKPSVNDNLQVNNYVKIDNNKSNKSNESNESNESNSHIVKKKKIN